MIVIDVYHAAGRRHLTISLHYIYLDAGEMRSSYDDDHNIYDVMSAVPQPQGLFFIVIGIQEVCR